MFKDKKAIIPVLIAVLVGGLVFAVVQRNKPQPLSSSAFEANPDYPPGCGSYVQLGNQFAMQSQPRPVLKSYIDELNAQHISANNAFGNCVNLVCDPYTLQQRNANANYYRIQQEINAVSEEISNLIYSNPAPRPADIETEINDLKAYRDKMYPTLNKARVSVEEAAVEVSRNGCSNGNNLNHFTSSIKQCNEPPTMINGQEWCTDTTNQSTGGGGGVPENSNTQQQDQWGNWLYNDNNYYTDEYTDVRVLDE